ncbi:hypothetical protein D3C72_2075220 [compost metagenome]
MAGVVALQFVAAFAAQEFELRLVLHAFGDHFQAEPVAEPDHRAGNLRVAAAFRYVADEAAVDLDRIDREAAQVGK